MTTKYLRLMLDLAIPEVPGGKDFQGIKLPGALVDKMPAIVNSIRDLKALSRRINEGKVNEEPTVRAAWHICYHEFPQPHPVCDEKDV